MEDDTKKGSSQLLSLVVILSGILPLNLGMLPSLCSPAHLSTASQHVFLADSPKRNSKHTAHKTLFPQRWSLWKRPSAFSEHFKISIYFLQKLETHFKIFFGFPAFWLLGNWVKYCKRKLSTELKLTCHEDGAKHENTGDHLQPDLQNFQRSRTPRWTR